MTERLSPANPAPDAAVSAGIRLLVVDDEPALRRTLSMVLGRYGYAVEVAEDPDDAVARLEVTAFDVVLTDMRMGAEARAGIRLLKTIQLRWPQTPVILLTAHAEVAHAIEALNARAYKFIEKPLNTAVLLEMVQGAVALRASHRMMAAVHPGVPDSLVGTAPAFRSAVKVALMAAATDATVLIAGETGTGKEVLARAIHAASPRASGPFQAINCGAITPSLLESLLFGHVKGAFTDAKEASPGLLRAAESGTVLLDEIGDMPIDLQVKLLRVLQEREVLPVGATHSVPINVRFIAATHRQLKSDIQIGRFREDLFYRLATIEVHLPALRDRPEDVPILTTTVLQRLWTRLGRAGAPPTVPPEIRQRFADYRWPGNIRELEQAIERLCILRVAGELALSDLPERLRVDQPHRVPEMPKAAVIEDRREGVSVVADATGEALSKLSPENLPPLALIEHIYCRFVLERVGGAKKRAAAVLDIDPNTLARKLKRAPGMTPADSAGRS